MVQKETAENSFDVGLSVFLAPLFRVFSTDSIVFNLVLLQGCDVIIPKHTVYNCVYHDTQLKPTGNHPEYQRRVISGAAAKKFIKKKSKENIQIDFCSSAALSLVGFGNVLNPHQHLGIESTQ